MKTATVTPLNAQEAINRWARAQVPEGMKVLVEEDAWFVFDDGWNYSLGHDPPKVELHVPVESSGKYGESWVRFWDLGEFNFAAVLAEILKAGSADG